MAPAAPNESPSVSRRLRRPVGVFMLLQPLVVAYSALGVPAGHKAWIISKSLEITKHIGMDEGIVEKMLNSLASS